MVTLIEIKNIIYWKNVEENDSQRFELFINHYYITFRESKCAKIELEKIAEAIYYAFHETLDGFLVTYTEINRH
jgi:hypothetical protein